MTARIMIEPGKRSGQPCVRGLRITVWDVLSWLAAGMTEQQILDDYPELEADDFRAVYEFAARMGRRCVTSAHWGEAPGEREFLCGHIDYVVEAILEVNQHKQSIRGMEIVEAPPFLRHFSARMRQMQEVAGEPQRSAKKTSELRSDAQGGALYATGYN